jgi:putative transposase
MSITLDAAFRANALEKALCLSQPGIFNMDQGEQSTSVDFLSHLGGRSIQLSMDGRGRVYDNIFNERLWRTLKYKEAYLHDYARVLEAENHIGSYFEFYNTARLHESLGYRTPHEVYSGHTFNPELVQAISAMHLKGAHFCLDNGDTHMDFVIPMISRPSESWSQGLRNGTFTTSS